jgi:hypothetical protein
MIEKTQIEIPEAVWQHVLFRDKAGYVAPQSALSLAEYDYRYRRLRHMPSTADGCSEQMIRGFRELHQSIYKRWEASSNTTPGERQVPEQIARVLALGQRGGSSEMLRLAAGRLKRSLPEAYQAYVRNGDSPPAEILASLQLLEVVWLDAMFRRHPVFRKPYLKKLYRLIDEGMQFNATTDGVRMRPILDWVVTQASTAGITPKRYVDVGCAMAAGAPNVRLAAERLRGEWPELDIHGMDIVAPEKAFSRRMLAQHRIKLYNGDVVQRPLPVCYDVIVLANVHRHLDHDAQQQALQHLAQSLNEQGLLFINWRFNDRESPTLCLQRSGDALRICDEGNVV